MKKKDTAKTLEEAIISLYLDVKVRKQDEIENMNSSMLKDEKENLKKTNPLVILDYIKNSIDILIELKVEERIEAYKKENSEEDEDKQNEYETLLRKLESDIRQHIRMEHQLKLHSESLQMRIDELEKENTEIVNKNQTINEKNSELKKQEISNKEKKDPEVSSLKNEIQNLKQILKSYEDQALKLSDLEKKFRNQSTKHEKEMKILEDNYKEKIRIFSMKLNNYEEMLKVNTTFRKHKKDEDELDRVNYDDHSHSHNSQNNTKTEILPRKVKVASTERKMEADNIKDKIEQYKKIIDKKINEISSNHSQLNFNKKTLNKSLIAGVDLFNDRSSSNHSLIKDKTLDINSSKSHRKNDSLIKNLENATKKMLVKENYKTHYRHSSMEIKYNDSNNKVNSNSKSPSTGVNLTKNIHAMKELLFNGQSNNKSTSKNPKPPTRQNGNTSSNIIVNQGGNPCFNHITIYTSNTREMKPNDINLRQYIFNKVNKPKSLLKLGAGHIRSASTNMHA